MRNPSLRGLRTGLIFLIAMAVYSHFDLLGRSETQIEQMGAALSNIRERAGGYQ